MDIANKLFSLTLGVEPNKATLQQVASTLNSAVLSLADKQKALEQFADTAEAQKFVSQAPIPQQQFTQPQIQYIQAAPTPQAAQARRAKILRDPVVWQISEKQMKELQWKRKQLLQAQKAELERKRAARAKRPPPPKLGASKNGVNKTQQAKAPQPKALQSKAEPLKAPQAKATQKKAPAIPKTPAAKAPATPKHSDTYAAIDSSKANLCGKNVFICGASKGTGRATTLSFAKAGASCIAIGARSDQVALEKDIKDAAVAAKKDPPKVLQIKLDVTDQKSVERAASDVEQQLGRLDILVHNAGVLGTPNPIVDSDPENWWRTWDVNLRGPYLVTRAFLPLMLKEGDKQIVNVSSVGSHLTSPGLSSYQTSKLALLRFTEFVVSEYGEKRVLAFSIHPGNILGTDIMDAGDVPDSIKHIFTETTELPADTIVYLTQEKRGWLAGRYINCTWDMPELMAKEDEIVKEDKLKVRLVV